jgi:hypothetical protein
MVEPQLSVWIAPWALVARLYCRLLQDTVLAPLGMIHILPEPCFASHFRWLITLTVANERRLQQEWASTTSRCRCVITDAYRDKTGWYARYGFIPVEGAVQDGPQKMFLDIRTIRAALRHGSP